MKEAKQYNFVTPKDGTHLKGLQDKAILGLAKSRDHLHVALVATLIHIEKHGDRTGADNIITALKASEEGKRVRVQVIKWLETYGGLITEKDEKGNVTGFCGWQGSEYIRERFKNAKKNPWHKPEAKKREPVQFSLDKELEKLAKKVAKLRSSMGEITAEEREGIDLVLSAATARMIAIQFDLPALFAQIGIDEALAQTEDQQKAA